MNKAPTGLYFKGDCGMFNAFLKAFDFVHDLEKMQENDQPVFRPA
jgi:hypothetical protein